jgi:hypothetical protein
VVEIEIFDQDIAATVSVEQFLATKGRKHRLVTGTFALCSRILFFAAILAFHRIVIIKSGVGLGAYPLGHRFTGFLRRVGRAS